jgi:hypothetical protein
MPEGGLQPPLTGWPNSNWIRRPNSLWNARPNSNCNRRPNYVGIRSLGCMSLPKEGRGRRMALRGLGSAGVSQLYR